MNQIKITVDLPEGSHTSNYDEKLIDSINWQTEVERIIELIYKGHELIDLL